MKRVPIKPVSARQAKRSRELGTPKFGTVCGWCHTERATEFDHIIPRSLLPGENRDHRDNLMPSCQECNRSRADGDRPSHVHLTDRQIAFVVQQKGERFLERYFA